MTHIPTPSELASLGKTLNDQLHADIQKYAGDLPIDRHLTAAFSILVIANNIRDEYKRDVFMDLLRNGLTGEHHVRALGLRRWSPAKRCLLAWASVPGPVKCEAEDLIKAQSHLQQAMSPKWSVCIGDKLFSLCESRDAFNITYTPEALAELIPPFGAAVEKAFSHITGVEIVQSPTTTQHSYLKAFQRNWAQAAGCNVLDINSGLHQFGLTLK